MNDIRAYFDGSCEPINPGGTAKWGFIVHTGMFSGYCDHGSVGKGEGMTNNVAEYWALKECLKYLVANHKDDNIEIFGDSDMVINMVSGKWGRRKPHKKAPHLIPLLRECLLYMSLLPNCTIEWIPREENAEADELSKRG